MGQKAWERSLRGLATVSPSYTLYSLITLQPKRDIPNGREDVRFLVNVFFLKLRRGVVVVETAIERISV